MNIYLDIDGVVLANEKNASKHLYEFLEYIISNHNVYWLTTHCQGDAEYTLRHLSNVLPQSYIHLLSVVKPTSWDNNKTDAIDYSQPFIWFDDELYPEEREELEKRGLLGSWYEIDLSKNEEQLAEVLVFLKTLK